MKSRGGTMIDILEKATRSEALAIKLLAKSIGAKESEFNHIAQYRLQHPIDFIYNNLKFDVKYANPTLTSKAKRLPVWDFDLRGKQNYCDYFVLIGMVEQSPKSVFLVPAYIAPKHHIRISLNGLSHWNEYKLSLTGI